MKIESSQISYAVAHRSATSTVLLDETVASSRNSDAKRLPSLSNSNGWRSTGADIVKLSGLGGASSAGGREDLNDLTPAQTLAVLALEVFLGHKLKFLGSPSGSSGTSALSATPQQPAASSASASPGAGHLRVELHAEAEQMNFQAQGVVNTTDGRSIQFSAELNMRREYQSETLTAASSQTTDPLVVNFAGTPAQLTGAKVSFDLNSDGKPESISFVAGGSGFLVLDRNGDGKVNDGREMFGPQTGSGFAELAAYDSDGNGWIDENDPVFTNLRIWTQSGLSTLSEQGIGAISTSSAETPFALKDSANDLQGNVRASGVYLSENGSAGTIQEVDLAV